MRPLQRATSSSVVGVVADPPDLVKGIPFDTLTRPFPIFGLVYVFAVFAICAICVGFTYQVMNYEFMWAPSALFVSAIVVIIGSSRRIYTFDTQKKVLVVVARYCFLPCRSPLVWEIPFTDLDDMRVTVKRNGQGVVTHAQLLLDYRDRKTKKGCGELMLFSSTTGDSDVLQLRWATYLARIAPGPVGEVQDLAMEAGADAGDTTALLVDTEMTADPAAKTAGPTQPDLWA
jgi:hypothetical protein